jgi:hypothetical protein
MLQDPDRQSPSHKNTPDQAITSYVEALGWLDSNETDDTDTDALETLIRRDCIADIWDSLSDDQKLKVDTLDVKLRSKKKILSREFYPFIGKSPDRWWWTFYA